MLQGINIIKYLLVVFIAILFVFVGTSNEAISSIIFLLLGFLIFVSTFFAYKIYYFQDIFNNIYYKISILTRGIFVLYLIGFFIFFWGDYQHSYFLLLDLLGLILIFFPFLATELIWTIPGFALKKKYIIIKKIFPYHYSFIRGYRHGDMAKKIFLLSLEKEALNLPKIIHLILRELIELKLVTPLALLKPEAKKKYSLRFDSQEQSSGFTIESFKKDEQELSIVIRTFGSLVPDDIISGKARAKIYESLIHAGFLLRSLHYDKLSRTLIFQFFTQSDFEDPKLLKIAQQLEYAFTDLEIKNSMNFYPQLFSCDVIDRGENKDMIYTVKFTYTLPSGLSASFFSPEKIKDLNSYVRMPLYEHRLKSHEDKLDLYIELSPRPLEKIRFSDFPALPGMRVPLGFDLKYRKPVYLNFDKSTEQEGDYGFASHYIIAGATSSGKSIFIKFLILQLLRGNTVNDIRLFLVDPKVVTFNVFKDLPHLYAPVVSDAKKFKIVLQGIIDEVERRYIILAKNNVQNIQELKNKNIEDGKDMPHILVIVDEFADIIDSQQNRNIKEDIILALKRLGQKARAAGVHIILITQRATSANIDGEIKANMPGRIAFRVASEGDSQLILEDSCAAGIENPGEGYAKIGDTSDLIHFQAPYISDDEIRNEIAKYEGIPQDFFDKTLSVELLKKPLIREEITPKDLPCFEFPIIGIGINLETHKILTLDFARIEQKQDYEPTPHVIVAGATNSGKSKFAKLLVHQIANSGSPDLVKIILVDPKVVTFSVFEGLPHLYRPILTNHDELLPLLREILSEIQLRYRIFAEAKVENIDAYRIVKKKQLASIVIIIDEFADLLDSYDYKGRDEIEKLLKRFGQMARAAGIHMVIVTQRATSQNIPGEVRTHFAGRIAFRMNTESDSHYILEEAGAEKLPSAGLFLFKKANNEVEKGYAPLFNNEDLARMVDELKKKYPL